MIKKEFCKRQITVISNNLDFIFNNQILLKEIKEDKELRGAVESSLNALNTFEHINKTKKNITLLLKKFHEITGTKFSPAILTYAEEYEYLDVINWLAILCRNKYGISINRKKVKYEAKEILEVTPEQEKRDSIITSALGGEVNPANIVELSQKMQSASQRFQDDVKKGKIYIFNSKPKIMPITKLLFMYSFALFALSAFVLAIMYFVTSTEDFTVLDSQDKTLGFMEGIFWIILSGFAIQMTVKSMISWYGKRNDNVRYYFFWHITMLFFILSLLFICNSVFTTTNSITIFSSWMKIIHDTDSSYIKSCMYAMIVIISIVIASFFISTILLIIAISYNPKRDEKKITEIYKEYMKESNIPA